MTQPLEHAHLSYQERDALLGAHCGDPFSLLGPHPLGDGRSVVRVLLPHASSVELLLGDGARVPLARIEDSPLFAGTIPEGTAYRLQVRWDSGVEQLTEDPYSFGPLVGELDLHLFAEGNHRDLGHCLGARPMVIDGSAGGETSVDAPRSVRGVRFAVWAPSARRVSVVGDFNGWDGRRHPMRRRVTGVWEIFVPDVEIGARYKYEILGPQGVLPLKMDPVSLQVEAPPRTASVVADDTPFVWTDAEWMAARSEQTKPERPIAIYEVHLASWRRPGGAATPADWDRLAAELVPYVKDLGFTHLELLPIMAHPFGGSWGYQPLSLYAPHAEYGEPAGFARFVDLCHAAGLGVLLDWVPAHFPTDAHGMARFDGTALYEHEDPREGFHQDWNTLIYNLGRNEVHGFLIGSALHWLEHFHVDGLRVDAVASMLYRDYSRKAGEWIPNRHGGRENLESVDFLRHVNDVVSERCPGALMIAEESTSWPGVTHPTRHGGLGFHYKWNMGWMHDTLEYIEKDPQHRAYVHERITFGLVYATAERFVLPLSHDEVVHGKRSLFGKIPGDRWQRFATLRAYYGFMWAHPGKKLLFMGGELGEAREWNHDAQLDWESLADPLHAGLQSTVRDLNGLYTQMPALHEKDSDGAGFEWIVVDDRENSVFAFLRRGTEPADPVLVVSNFTPTPHREYRIGVPYAGPWVELLNTDATRYGGSNVGNQTPLETEPVASHGHAQSLRVTVPPLATVFLRRVTAST